MSGETLHNFMEKSPQKFQYCRQTLTISLGRNKETNDFSLETLENTMNSRRKSCQELTKNLIKYLKELLSEVYKLCKIFDEISLNILEETAEISSENRHRCGQKRILRKY